MYRTHYSMATSRWLYFTSLNFFQTSDQEKQSESWRLRYKQTKKHANYSCNECGKNTHKKKI